MEQIVVKPLPPFSLELSANILSYDDPQISFYENGRFTQPLRVGGKLILAVVESKGDSDSPELHVLLKANQELSEAEKTEAAEAICDFFNLNLDVSRFYEDVKHDATLAKITQRLRGLRVPTAPTVYEALVDSIVEQQISIKVAKALEAKIIKKFGAALRLDEVYYEYPTPQAIASASIEELRQCGLSQRKAEYILGVSKLVKEGALNLENFKQYREADAIIKELDAIRGVGVWTAELTMLRSMNKWSALPADDFGVQRVISHYYCQDKKISSSQAREIAKAWGSWKGLAAFYLI
ncbi:MAG: DNA-3-methyladenine glycosylase family protein, partial [Candidatus Bathyarchaeia archaeon]